MYWVERNWSKRRFPRKPRDVTSPATRTIWKPVGPPESFWFTSRSCGMRWREKLTRWVQTLDSAEACLWWSGARCSQTVRHTPCSVSVYCTSGTGSPGCQRRACWAMWFRRARYSGSRKPGWFWSSWTMSSAPALGAVESAVPAKGTPGFIVRSIYLLRPADAPPLRCRRASGTSVAAALPAQELVGLHEVVLRLLCVLLAERRLRGLDQSCRLGGAAGLDRRVGRRGRRGGLLKRDARRLERGRIPVAVPLQRLERSVDAGARAVDRGCPLRPCLRLRLPGLLRRALLRGHLLERLGLRARLLEERVHLRIGLTVRSVGAGLLLLRGAGVARGRLLDGDVRRGIRRAVDGAGARPGVATRLSGVGSGAGGSAVGRVRGRSRIGADRRAGCRRRGDAPVGRGEEGGDEEQAGHRLGTLTRAAGSGPGG